MRSKLGDGQRLQHIADAISEIEAFTKGVTFDAFSGNRMMVLACVKCFEIIGVFRKRPRQHIRALIGAM